MLTQFIIFRFSFFLLSLLLLSFPRLSPSLLPTLLYLPIFYSQRGGGNIMSHLSDPIYRYKYLRHQ